MKRSYVGVIGLCIVLALNIVFLQLLVHQFKYQNYELVLLYMGINLILFPIAIMIYRKEIHKGGDDNAK
ncbi:hypothetical protein SAMN05216389_104211 [Oceanobacillus limi]|uniref:Uncharacterized protein n=1 Tax=Oceanobacillus limi TaxID=930131 RepID=A0A1I0B6U9_9BACI|nr:hypothetical protein [Oceanobacillus limi]SET02506.1 hypothetical protein SAMN05216389_104211 [Oceanobacillus limi]